MDIQDERRGRLRAYIATHFSRAGDSRGNVSAFSTAIGIQQSQIADMLDRRKSFGEKVARRLEAEAARRHLPAMSLDGPFQAAREITETPRVPDTYDLLVGRSESHFHAEFRKLPRALQVQISQLVHLMVAEFKREPAVAEKKPPSGPRTSITKSPTNRPHG